MNREKVWHASMLCFPVGDFYLFYEFSIRPKILPYACGSILHIWPKLECVRSLVSHIQLVGLLVGWLFSSFVSFVPTLFTTKCVCWICHCFCSLDVYLCEHFIHCCLKCLNITKRKQRKFYTLRRKWIRVLHYVYLCNLFIAQASPLNGIKSMKMLVGMKPNGRHQILLILTIILQPFQIADTYWDVPFIKQHKPYWNECIHTQRESIECEQRIILKESLMNYESLFIFTLTMLLFTEFSLKLKNIANRIVTNQFIF